MKFLRILSDDGKPYGSYYDLLKLAELSGFEFVDQDSDWRSLDEPVIAYILNGNVRAWATEKRKCKLIGWQLERKLSASDSDFVPGTFDEIWVSDRHLASSLAVKYVPIGGHPELGCQPSPDKQYDLAPMAYLFGQREAAVHRLGKQYRIAPKAWPPERDRILASTRAGLCLHQHAGDAMIEPLRMTMFAMYRLPLVCEYSRDYYPYWTYDLDHIPSAMEDADGYAAYNYDLLTGTMSFRKCVEGALA